MKRSRHFLFGVLLLSMTFSPQAWAEEGTMSVGLKSWFSVWDTGEKDLPKSDTTLSWGPTFTYRKGKRFWGVSFLKGDFDFEETATSFKASVERSETDLFTGYQIKPNLALLLGVKHDRATLEIKKNINNGEDTFEIDEWRTVFGASAYHVFDAQRKIPVTIFGTLALVNGEFSGELGSSVPITDTSFNLYGGYKVQELGDGENVSGAFFGINYPLS